MKEAKPIFEMFNVVGWTEKFFKCIVNENRFSRCRRLCNW
jgi:hypothetical protein